MDVTPGSTETDERDFWSAFSGFFRDVQDPDGLDGNVGDFALGLSRFVRIVYIIPGLLLLYWFVKLIRLMIRKCMRYRKCHQPDEKEAAIASYADICDMLRTCFDDFNLCKSHIEQVNYMTKRYGLLPQQRKLSEWLERISYSNNNLSAEELCIVMEFIGSVRKMIWKNATFGQRIRLCKR